MVTAIDNEPMNDVELDELESVVEQHKTLGGINQGYGAFSAFCIPRLLATIRSLQRERMRLVKERDDAFALLRNMMG
ncbi:MAG TPA: hypothetical protein VF994_10020 [Myxococcales bacterium]